VSECVNVTWLGAVDMGERRILLGAEIRPVIYSLSSTKKQA
jgi:hypothetical protein